MFNNKVDVVWSRWYPHGIHTSVGAPGGLSVIKIRNVAGSLVLVLRSRVELFAGLDAPHDALGVLLVVFLQASMVCGGIIVHPLRLHGGGGQH